MSSNKAADPSSPISLVVISQDGNEIVFKIRRSTKIKKLLTAYCHRRFLDYGTVQFLIDGRRFADNKTPEELGLEDGGEIDAMLHVDGGSYDL